MSCTHVEGVRAGCRPVLRRTFLIFRVYPVEVCAVWLGVMHDRGIVDARAVASLLLAPDANTVPVRQETDTIVKCTTIVP